MSFNPFAFLQRKTAAAGVGTEKEEKPPDDKNLTAQSFAIGGQGGGEKSREGVIPAL